LIAVEDPRQPVDHPIITLNNLQPQVVYPAISGKEAMRARVNELTPELNGFCQPARSTAGFKDLHSDGGFGKLVGSGDTSGTSANDCDGHIVLALRSLEGSV
jgi:hypothetical protein